MLPFWRLLAVSVAVEKIVNGGFETALGDEWIPSVGSEQSAEQKRTGSYSCKFYYDVGTGSSGYIEQEPETPIAVSSIETFEFYHYAGVASELEVVVVYVEGGETVIAVTNTGTSTWTIEDIKAALDSSKTIYYFSIEWQQGVIYVDDVTLFA